MEDFGKCDQFAHRTVRNVSTPKLLTLTLEDFGKCDQFWRRRHHWIAQLH